MKKDANLHETMDGAVWAKEFVRINGGDEGTMIAWFANAIMTGYDHSRWTKIKELTALLKIQGQDGNWNSSEGMLGLYNGLELSLATIEGREPQYRSIGESACCGEYTTCNKLCNCRANYWKDLVECKTTDISKAKPINVDEAYNRAMKVLK